MYLLQGELSAVLCQSKLSRVSDDLSLPLSLFLMLLNRSMNNFCPQKISLICSPLRAIYYTFSHFIKTGFGEKFKNYINPFSNLLAFKILHITQQAAIYLLEESFGGCAVLETDAVSDFLSETHVHFLGHTLGDGHGCHSPGLGTGHTLLLIPTPHPL